ncbi:MAG: hypothetical protein DMF78_17140 [Acidobacteria bacterium]|nr:MAG: hypothetical protein DMF78_17140 [Acidobacteriota bacterium]
MQVDAQAMQRVEGHVGQRRIRDERPVAQREGGRAEGLRLGRQVRPVAEERVVPQRDAAEIDRAADVHLHVVGIEVGHEGQGPVEEDARRDQPGQRGTIAGGPRGAPERDPRQQPRREGERDEAGEHEQQREGHRVREMQDEAGRRRAGQHRGPRSRSDGQRERAHDQGRRGHEHARAGREAQAAGRGRLDLRDPDHGLGHELVGHAHHRQRAQGEAGVQRVARAQRHLVEGPGSLRDRDVARGLAVHVERHQRAHAREGTQAEPQVAIARGDGQMDTSRGPRAAEPEVVQPRHGAVEGADLLVEVRAVRLVPLAVQEGAGDAADVEAHGGSGAREQTGGQGDGEGAPGGDRAVGADPPVAHV